MPRSRLRPPRVAESPNLARVIAAANHQATLDPVRFRGHARTLAELFQLAALMTPARGVLAPSEEVCKDIDRIAQRHLRRDKAEREFLAALDSISRIEQRDAIDVAHVLMVDITERAYYYAGLASGITLIERAGK